MTIQYKITEESKNVITKYDWLNSHYSLGEIGSYDNREITRLLINHHYVHLHKILIIIDKNGNRAGSITKNLLLCNDPMNFSRLLAELFLFNHLYKNIGPKVQSNTIKPKKPTHDINVDFNDLLFRIEVYSPTDSFSFQLFSNLVRSLIKNLQIKYGFDIKINSKSTSFNYTYAFPPFRIVLNWLNQFESELISWIESTTINESKSFNSPLNVYTMKITILRKDYDIDNRSIIWGGATYSTDLRRYFEINDPTKFSNTNLGTNIFDKLSKQQAGSSEDNIIRVLILNFALADTPDLCFFNNKKHYLNIEKDILYLASTIKPYPPYDVVIPCELSFECGFTSPIVLATNITSHFSKYLSSLGFNNPIK